MYNQKPWFMKESEVGPEKAHRKLSEGVVGSRLIAFFEEHFGITPVYAIHTDGNPYSDKIEYRITFTNGYEADYLITWESGNSLNIVAAEEYDRADSNVRA